MAGVTFVLMLVQVLADLRHFSGYSPLMRGVAVFIWAGQLMLGPWIVTRMPWRFRRVFGRVCLGCALLSSILVAASLVAGEGWRVALWSLSLLANVYGSHVFLVDADVRTAEAAGGRSEPA